jgi:hypothetical protein
MAACGMDTLPAGWCLRQGDDWLLYCGEGWWISGSDTSITGVWHRGFGTSQGWTGSGA